MSNKEIIGKSLFQVNLLLLASWDSSSMMVNPIFYNAGYRVIVIEQLLKVPDVIYSDLTSKNINIQKSSRPEFILEHQDNKLYLSIECKKSWFSIESSTSRQAFSMLLISGDIINNALGKTGSLPWENQVT